MFLNASVDKNEQISLPIEELRIVEYKVTVQNRKTGRNRFTNAKIDSSCHNDSFIREMMMLQSNDSPKYAES